MNSVDALLNRPFSSRTLQEKIEIKSLGRPVPDLAIDQTGKCSKDRSFRRHFKRDIYNTYSWICGCNIRNKLFCFPCLLFGSNDSWSKNGVSDLGHIHEYAKKHSASKKHLNNMLDLSALGNVNIAVCLSRAYQESIEKHNAQVEKNRYVLSRIIDCMKFCGAFELALRGHDESEHSDNPGIFLGLVDLISSIDSAVKEHIESSSVFKGTSKTVQNELLECMLEVCRDKIKEELNKTNFVALMADETTDISDRLQLVLVFRYELEGVVQERFWGFFNPEGQTASEISECILAELRSLMDEGSPKLIAQTYDGAAVMRGSVNGVQSMIREHFPLARYVHCYAHQLNLVMEKAASQNISARVFFCSLSAFPAFFSRSPQRTAVLENVVARRIPTGSSTRWNFKSRTVNVVYEYKDALVECLQELEKSTSAITVREARGLRHYLEDDEFVFWLTFFHRIFPHVDILFNQIQSRQTDTVKVNNSISQFISVIEKIRSDSETTMPALSAELPKKRRRDVSHLNADAKEVCDRITEETRSRFQATSHLDASRLVDSANFEEFCKKFPDNVLTLTVKNYPILNQNRLQTELSVFYERPDFRNVDGAVNLLKLILRNNLQDAFSEITTLLRLIVTIPMTTAEPERCFSSLKRIKTFMRNAMSQDRLTALAMLAIEKNLISQIPDFNSKVIEKFAAKKTRRIELNFRS